MGRCQSGDHIAKDHIHTDITTRNSEGPQLVPKSSSSCFKELTYKNTPAVDQMTKQRPNSLAEPLSFAATLFSV